ncbi:hypothetical protein GCM10027429_02900 [Marivirga atlantica]|uniref:TnsE C-terminal domain-containing protein n=1 Tax=Marivirga atlantica TaxID=1548457 RepID=A0A937AJK7_9BACT|nr:Tn7-like element transposition protein TnsE [Marivirga atlantica]MBL0763902.1 hypothetical protein [Marivirga atlantica]
MAFQIYAVSECFNQYGNFFVRCHIVDTNTKEVGEKIFPITQIPKLAIGPEYQEDNTIKVITDKASTEVQIFENFNDGTFCSLEDLPSISQFFSPTAEALQNAKYYLLTEAGSTYAFPCYELFRSFLGLDNRSLKLLFQYDAIESFIDNDYGGVRKTRKGTELTLDLNRSFPKSLLPFKMIEKIILVLYEPTIRGFWKSIQSQLISGTSNFENGNPFFNTLNLKFTCKNLNESNIKLVHYIGAIQNKIPFPAEYVTINHPDLRSRKKRTNTKEEEGEDEKGKQSFKVPISKDNKESDRESNDKYEEVQALFLEYEFDKEVKIQKNRSKNEEQSNDDKSNPFAIRRFENGELSLNQDNDKQGDSFLALNRDYESNKFDQADIAPGLVFFTKVVEFLTSRLSLNFQYKVHEFKDENAFQFIGSHKRKGVMVQLQLKNPIYIIEVDSSDNRFISTLLMTNLRSKKTQELFDLIFSELAQDHGTWPQDTLELYADYRLIRHPRRTKSLTQTIEFDGNSAQKYIERFADRLVGVLS